MLRFHRKLYFMPKVLNDINNIDKWARVEPQRVSENPSAKSFKYNWPLECGMINNDSNNLNVQHEFDEPHNIVAVGEFEVLVLRFRDFIIAFMI